MCGFKMEARTHWLAIGLALLVALAIIAIGVRYVASPMSATRSFGLPFPEEGPNVAWWLRLKGVRDIVSGLVLLAMMAWGGPAALGIVLLVEAIISVDDMSLILVAKGLRRHAFLIHGVTASLMILGAIPLLTGVP